jgi:hypothetical protein
MKSPLVSSVAILFALSQLSLAEDKPLKERAGQAVESLKRETRDATAAAAKVARQAWNATQAYLTEDPREFREGATRKLEELNGDVTALKENASVGPMAQRHYFVTRVTSLSEQVEFVRGELGKVPGGKESPAFDAARTRFNTMLGHLEKAVDQAQSEVGDAS